MMIVWNDLKKGTVALGLVRAAGVQPDQVPPDLDDALEVLLNERRQPLTPAEEHRRQAARDMLRNGVYKPTGRGKPASEYLLRAASSEQRSFPRINGPVDVCNYLSLKTVLPISLWDHDRAAASAYRFRLGHPDEAYVFNAGGQQIALQDLVVGCAQTNADKRGTPIVNPVKDSMATKTTVETTHVVASIYAPQDVVQVDELRTWCAEFAGWLAECGEDVQTAYDVALPQSRVEV